MEFSGIVFYVLRSIARRSCGMAARSCTTTVEQPGWLGFRVGTKKAIVWGMCEAMYDR